jgi:hypothetical protein
MLTVREDYRFGFNGQEKTNEIAGVGNHNTALFWEYDTRLGRRWNIDPVVKEWESLFATFGSNPIVYIDPDGADFKDPKGNVRKSPETTTASPDGRVISNSSNNGNWETGVWNDQTEIYDLTIKQSSVITNTSANEKSGNSSVDRKGKFNNAGLSWLLDKIGIDKTETYFSVVAKMTVKGDVNLPINPMLKKLGLSPQWNIVVPITGYQYTAVTEDSQDPISYSHSVLNMSNSYASLKAGRSDFRIYPSNGLMQAGGDWNPGFRTLVKLKTVRKVIDMNLDYSNSMNGGNWSGVRFKYETKSKDKATGIENPISIEVSSGFRFHRK